MIIPATSFQSFQVQRLVSQDHDPLPVAYDGGRVRFKSFNAEYIPLVDEAMAVTAILCRLPAGAMVIGGMIFMPFTDALEETGTWSLWPINEDGTNSIHVEYWTGGQLVDTILSSGETGPAFSWSEGVFATGVKTWGLAATHDVNNTRIAQFALRFVNPTFWKLSVSKAETTIGPTGDLTSLVVNGHLLYAVD